MVVCGEEQLADDWNDALLNSALIIEVLSPSTERYDFVEKFDAYQRIPSLREYVLVSQDQYRVEVRTKQKDWSEFHIYSQPSDQIPFQAVPAVITLSEFYDQVAFEM